MADIANNDATTTIHSTKLQGHQGAVLCLDHNSSTSTSAPSGGTVTAGCLLSGSEDGTARLWDLRANLRAVSCLVAGDEVVSVAFGPHATTPLSINESGPFARNFIVYLSVGNKVLGYDLRKASGPIVQLSSEAACSVVVEADDEVNQIVLSEQRGRSRPLHLAAADDSGIVQIVSDSTLLDPSTPGSASSKTNKKRVLHDPEHIAMVTTAVFRPRSKHLELASGGTDCQIQLWDINKPKKAVSSHRIAPDQSGSSNQLCNPPMVHSLNFSPSGRLLAAGLGDGTCRIFSIENRSLVEVGRLHEEGHESPIASILFPAFLPSDESHKISSQDRLFASIGNNAVINFWDLGVNVAGDGALDPARTLLGETNETCDGVDGISSAVGGLSLIADQPRLLFSIPHNQKPNWMASSRGLDPLFTSSIFLADTTNDITIYTVPMR